MVARDHNDVEGLCLVQHPVELLEGVVEIGDEEPPHGCPVFLIHTSIENLAGIALPPKRRRGLLGKPAQFLLRFVRATFAAP